MCREWVVREDGALAYHLQNQEISEHLQGNRFRNAVVREDFPRALDEQIREQQLAEQAAAVYHQMLAEQEEGDVLFAKRVADNLEKEDKFKKRVLETHDEFYAWQLQDNGIDIGSRQRVHQPLQKAADFPSPHRPDKNNYHANSPRRQALPMPLPSINNANIHGNVEPEPTSADNYLYVEPYKPSDLVNQFDRIDIAEVGLPLLEINERERQQLKDEQLARELQEQEDSSEQSQLNRDRLLAIEAQDKELAKLLQERERQKAKRARERAKQRALAKKQQQAQVQDIHQIMPDDSYSTPADLLPVPQNVMTDMQVQGETIPNDEDFNYSFPADVIPHKGHEHNLKQNYSPPKNYKMQYSQDHMKILNNANVDTTEIKQSLPVRPTQLDLKFTNYPSKPRYPSPGESIDHHLQSPTQHLQPPTQHLQSPTQHTNIAMAIDPTYNRRSQHSVPYYDTSSSTVTTSTSSSSPPMVLPPTDLPEEEDGPIPPYMPIQGQRRTSSLEKKAKKKPLDSCKQQ
ncbi:hypothetical protein RN001_009728 [Aquatica leii]|uniref:Coiled-coil domain-containing protein n=1 Tax=Aquatica leii TaxID=1421715 RepID=A0AAN7PVN5_9COLE|nr:hypothetical protein RN001_009728 [Aquatica leii]